MPLDVEQTQTAGSAAWWLLRLGQRLDADAPRMRMLDDYARGEHPLPVGHERCRASYQRFQRQSRSNLVGLVVDAVLDRLTVTGFRMGGQADAAADQAANQVWQANHLDADATLVMRDALVMGRSYVSVGPGDPPVITGEDPRQVIHASDPVDRRRLRAALKTWTDEVDGRIHAVVYLPATVHYFVATGEATQLWHPTRWDVDTGEGADGVAPNPTEPIVPVVPFINRPDVARDGFSEFADVIDIQDRINSATLDRLVTSAVQAFRQRWATGVRLEDADGNPAHAFDPGADLLWSVDDPNARFGDFAAADLRQFIDGIKTDVEQLASISRTPPYYLLGQMANLSGEALTAADAGLTAKVVARQRQFGESWEQVMRLAFTLRGLTAAVDAETIWAGAERRSIAELADAAVKKASVGVPVEQIWEDLGYTPAQRTRMKIMQAAQVLNAAVTASTQGGPAAAGVARG